MERRLSEICPDEAIHSIHPKKCIRRNILIMSAISWRLCLKTCIQKFSGDSPCRLSPLNDFYWLQQRIIWQCKRVQDDRCSLLGDYSLTTPHGTSYNNCWFSSLTAQRIGGSIPPILCTPKRNDGIGRKRLNPPKDGGSSMKGRKTRAVTLMLLSSLSFSIMQVFVKMSSAEVGTFEQVFLPLEISFQGTGQ